MKYSVQLRAEELVKVSGGAGDGGAYMYYAVKNGDTWASIAAKYGTTEAALRQVNSCDEIYPGMTILVPFKR